MNILIFLDDFFEKKKLKKEFIKSLNNLIDHSTTLYVVSKQELPFPEVFFQKNGINSVKIKVVNFPEIHSTLSKNIYAFVSLNNVKGLNIVYSETLDLSGTYITQLNSKKWDANLVLNRKTSKKSAPSSYFSDSWMEVAGIKKTKKPSEPLKTWAQVVAENKEYLNSKLHAPVEDISHLKVGTDPLPTFEVPNPITPEDIEEMDKIRLKYKNNTGINWYNAPVSNTTTPTMTPEEVSEATGMSIESVIELRNRAKNIATPKSEPVHGKGLREQMEDSIYEPFKWKVQTSYSPNTIKKTYSQPKITSTGKEVQEEPFEWKIGANYTPSTDKTDNSSNTGTFNYKTFREKELRRIIEDTIKNDTMPEF